MIRLLFTAFALVGILSAPAFFRSPPAALPADGIADCKQIKLPGLKASLD
jgi:hypothetical protein